MREVKRTLGFRLDEDRRVIARAVITDRREILHHSVPYRRLAFYALGPTPKIANVPVVRLKGIYAKLGFFTAPFRSEGRFFGSSIMPFSLRPSLSFYAYGNGDPGLRPRHCCLRVLYS